MKVTNDMINKDIRTTGVLIRTLYKFRKEKQFRTCNKMLDRFTKGKFPKGLHVEERFIEREDHSQMRILICFPKAVQENATGVL